MLRLFRANSIAPALGVRPPSKRLAHNSTRSAPPPWAAIADSTVSTHTSMIGQDWLFTSQCDYGIDLQRERRYRNQSQAWRSEWHSNALSKILRQSLHITS